MTNVIIFSSREDKNNGKVAQPYTTTSGLQCFFYCMKRVVNISQQNDNFTNIYSSTYIS